jgi:outer membrane protein
MLSRIRAHQKPPPPIEPIFLKFMNLVSSRLSGLAGGSAFVLLLAGFIAAQAQTNPPAAFDLFRQPLSRSEAVALALRQNGSVLQAQADAAAAEGVSVQSLSLGNPKIRTSGEYRLQDRGAIESSPFTPNAGHQNWSASAQIVQPLYAGGRIQSGQRQSRLVREQAAARFQTVRDDTIVNVLITYDDILLAAELITVQEASVHLLERELEDNKRRFDAGTAPKFNVLRAEVALANARPRLIKARNSHRIAKNNLVNQLGYDLPATVWDDIPLTLAGKLQADPVALDLPKALATALELRPELAAQRKEIELRRENVKTAKAGSKPSLDAFLGYGGRNSSLSSDLSKDVSGWFAGAQISWDVFDGQLTKGKVAEASALADRSEEALRDQTRQVTLEVRTAWSNVSEAREVLDSQQKTVEQAEEALRLARARADAGTGTQLEILDAETALTEARSIQAQALRDYSVARTRLEKAAGILGSR